MAEAVNTLVEVVGKLADGKKDADFYNLYQGLTLDVIGNHSVRHVLHGSGTTYWSSLSKSSLKFSIFLSAFVHKWSFV
jgi:hypothetical protein